MSKRKSFDIAAIQAAARPQPDPVQVAVSTARVPSVAVVPDPESEQPAEELEATSVPEPAEQVTGLAPVVARKTGKGSAKTGASLEATGRTGKVAVQTWITPSRRRQLRLYALTHDRTVDSLLLEALDDLFRKRKIG